MRKVCMLLLTQLLLFGTASYGAVSEDMSAYVRKDVFEVYMQNINAKFDTILEEIKSQRKEVNDLTNAVSGLSERVTALSTRVDGLEASLSARIDGLDSRLSARIDGLDARLSARIDGLDARMGDLRNDIYLGLVILGIIIALPMVQKMLQAQADRREARKPYVTLEEVIRLIEENNAKVGKSSQ